MKTSPIPTRYLGPVFAFSFLLNLLYLIGPVFMMQVYDRVIPGGSIPTLVGLSAIALLLYVFFGVLDAVRTQLLTLRGEAFAKRLAAQAFFTSLDAAVNDPPDSSRRSAVQDVSLIRNFLVSAGFAAIFDLVWMPVFLIFIFTLHSALGITAVLAAILLISLAIVNERTSRKRVRRGQELKQVADNWVSQSQRQATTLLGNGMNAALTKRWLESENQARLAACSIAGTASVFTTVTKTMRLVIQSLILALGAFLVVHGEMSAGGMIAASVVFSRTLAPVEQLLGNFVPMIKARQAWSRVREWINEQSDTEKLQLPEPSESLDIHIQRLSPPALGTSVLQNVQIDLKAGDVLGVIGASGGGKSSFGKAVAGAWPVAKGKISLDGADYKEWPREQLGAAIGYMSQEAEFLDGTIAENICGFQENIPSEDVIAACQNAGAHKMILGLNDGYNTKISANGAPLSAGQRQRLTLARALFGNPFLIVLDEPNSNLDDQGEAALAAAIRKMKDAGKIVIVIAHRQKILREATKLCVIENGVMKISGPKHAVESRMAMPADSQKQPRKSA